MKCLVTGSTSGIGKKFVEYCESQNWEVYKISRSDGYDIEKDFHKIIRIAKSCDIVFNNLCYNDCQIKLLQECYRHVSFIINSGGIIREFSSLKEDVSYIKQKLYTAAEEISVAPTHLKFAKILYLDFSFNEESTAKDRFNNTNCTRLSSIITIIDQWLNDPCYWYIRFPMILETEFYKEVENLHPKIDYLYDNMLELSRE
jgi:hypothetical protein